MATTWGERYNIVSTTGRVYTRAMVYRRCMRMCGPGNGPGVRALLNDDGFMRRHTGMVPSAIAHDVFGELAGAGQLVIEDFATWKARRSGA